MERNSPAIPNKYKLKNKLINQLIISQNHDYQEFLNYIQKEIPQYSFNDIPINRFKYHIDEFVKSKNKPISQILRSGTQRYRSSYSKIIKQEIHKHKQFSYLKKYVCSKNNNLLNLTQYGINSQHFITYTQCEKSFNPVINKKQLSVQVTSHYKHQKNNQNKDLIKFKIQTKQQKWQVQRTYQEFEWLREVLEYHHKGLVIPPLSENILKINFTTDFINKMSRVLTVFLRKIITVEELKHDNQLLMFLSFPDYPVFKKICKETKLQKKNILQRTRTCTGKLQYGITPQLLSTIKKAENYFQTISPTLFQIHKQQQNIKSSLLKCIESHQKINNSLQKLALDDKIFVNNVFNSKEKTYKSTYQDIAFIMKNQKTYFESVSKSLKLDFGLFFENEYHHVRQFSEKIHSLGLYEKKYNDMRKQIINEKIKMYNKDISKWSMDDKQKQKIKWMKNKPSLKNVGTLLKVSSQKQFNDFQLEYGVQCYRIFKSILHHFRLNNKYINKQVKLYLQKESKGLTDQKQIIQEKISKILQTKKNNNESSLNDDIDQIVGIFEQLMKQDNDCDMWSQQMDDNDKLLQQNRIYDKGLYDIKNNDIDNKLSDIRNSKQKKDNKQGNNFKNIFSLFRSEGNNGNNMNQTNNNNNVISNMIQQQMIQDDIIQYKGLQGSTQGQSYKRIQSLNEDNLSNVQQEIQLNSIKKRIQFDQFKFQPDTKQILQQQLLSMQNKFINQLKINKQQQKCENVIKIKYGKQKYKQQHKHQQQIKQLKPVIRNIRRKNKHLIKNKNQLIYNQYSQQRQSQQRQSQYSQQLSKYNPQLNNHKQQQSNNKNQSYIINNNNNQQYVNNISSLTKIYSIFNIE